jgi:hypothetical protein
MGIFSLAIGSIMTAAADGSISFLFDSISDQQREIAMIASACGGGCVFLTTMVLCIRRCVHQRKTPVLPETVKDVTPEPSKTLATTPEPSKTSATTTDGQIELI